MAHGSVSDELADVLGVEPAAARRGAVDCLTHPHPQVACGAAVWNVPAVDTPALIGWKGGLPGAMDTGDLPSQQELDRWAQRRTDGLIRRFPLPMDPTIVFILASALATKVSWRYPFRLAPGSALGPSSPWTGLAHVLETPGPLGHRQFVGEGARCGALAVHIAHAQGGVAVCSVIGEAGLPAGDVLADAHDIAMVEARRPGSAPRRPLFDLPLGEGPCWTITEAPVLTTAPGGTEERFVTFLPAWSVESRHRLETPGLGFDAAAEALRQTIGPLARFSAGQSALARYSRVGFEAAAVSALAMASSAPSLREGVRRTAELRFGHPFAAVAFVVPDDRDRALDEDGPWVGLPIFSAWVAEPSEPDEGDGAGGV